MKKVILLLTVITTALLCASCSSDNDEGSEGVVLAKLVGTWRVEKIQETGVGGHATFYYYPKGTFTITFNSDGSFSTQGSGAVCTDYGFSDTKSDVDVSILSKFTEWNRWSKNSPYKDNEVYIGGSGYSGEAFTVSYAGQYQTEDAILSVNDRYPKYILSRLK